MTFERKEPNKDIVVDKDTEALRTRFNAIAEVVRQPENNRAIELMNEVNIFVSDLEKKYPDARKYRDLYAISFDALDGSEDKFDFPGEDSIELFIEGLEKKYLKKE